MTIEGKATVEGTSRYRQGLGKKANPEHFVGVDGMAFSSIGLGTYLGGSDDETDSLVEEAVIASVQAGVNLIDTAINYRHERAEKCIGQAIGKLTGSGFSRDELVLCTKGGFLPHPANPLGWFKSRFVNNADSGVSMSDLAAGVHCMHPDYLADQVDASLANLGVKTLDVYYIHNPETQLSEIEPDAFLERIEAAFGKLEEAVGAGKIQYYGLATWNAFRIPKDKPGYIDLVKVKNLARKVAGGEDHFRFIQLPFNLAMPEALLANQELEGEPVPVLEAARQMGIHVVASASICQAQVVGQIPPAVAIAIGKELTDAQRALQFTRSSPGLVSALVGMKQPAHLKENLSLVALPPLDAKAYLSIIGQSG